ncbi:WAP four-disulfide core domain protein 3-like isoform X4 [Cyprinus carpio]|uniref:WAP four-disulfide core domain protein 3-like isoform X4 n=1 Tax=Cyprinus carpio TaxID=7962 RepID=A0A9Q9VYJ9_CYPCA|nr:WAP four-disulfide core domain protein 3-like isoform X4 [Cyprinus carpio]
MDVDISVCLHTQKSQDRVQNLLEQECVLRCVLVTVAVPKQSTCCSNGCGRQCMLPYKEKPGVCPRTTPRMKGVCAERCSHDGDCPNDEKCCSNGCGHQCTALPKEKPGMCPMTLAGLRGIVCEELCVSDFDCREMRRLQLYLWRTSMYTCILSEAWSISQTKCLLKTLP